MKKSLTDYKEHYQIITEIVKTLDHSSIIIFKATVTDPSHYTGKTTIAHASGAVDSENCVNNIELRAIEKAISLQ